MSVGFVMLAHTALSRAVDVAMALTIEGCPVVIHVDKRTPVAEFEMLRKSLADEPLVSFSHRYSCNWGTWSLVEASRGATEQLLAEHPLIEHVALISGACLPIKPIADMKEYLALRTGTDFIESVTVEDVPWTIGGLSEERFSLSFPFSWKRQRNLFDLWVNLQRRLEISRRIPHGLAPHLGSQWWCLSRQTLERMFSDPRRDEFDKYFRRVWIPDESYFQTLVRLYGTKIESRSLTLSKFDYQGKPHVFYDDHLNLLADSTEFFARKIWPRAERLYRTFLSGDVVSPSLTTSLPGAFADRLFGRALAQRTQGRSGLVMAGRYPNEGFENGVTAAPYAVCHGFGEVFEGFQDWLERETGTRSHGNLFARERVQFANDQQFWHGGLSDNAVLRDYDPESFLRNLIWNTKGEHQSFQLSAHDNLKIGKFLATDRNASVFVITGAWILPLLRTGASADVIRPKAALLQAAEARLVNRLKERRCQAHVRIWSLADVIERPIESLQQILTDLSGPEMRSQAEPLEFASMDGLAGLLQALRNSGMNPYLAGDVSDLPVPSTRSPDATVVRLR